MFEPSPETTEPRVQHRTWDVDSDLATRAVDMKNVINKHETIAKEPEETTETTTNSVKLSSILKKSSGSDRETTTVQESRVSGEYNKKFQVIKYKIFGNSSGFLKVFLIVDFLRYPILGVAVHFFLQLKNLLSCQKN